MNTTQDVQLSLIDIPECFRQHTMESVDALAQDIQRNGQLQEVVVTPKDGGRYELVAGKRRTLALRHLNKETIRAQVMESLNELQKALIMIAENDERADVNPFDRALSYQRAINAGTTRQDLASKLGISADMFNKVLSLLQLTPEVTEKTRRLGFSGAHLQEIVRLPDAPSQLKMADACDKQGWSSKVLRDKVSRSLAGPGEAKAKVEPTVYHAGGQDFRFIRKGESFSMVTEPPSMDMLDVYSQSFRCAVIDFLAGEEGRLKQKAA